MTLTTYPWTPELALGEERMDQTHREFVALVDAVLTAPDAEMLERMDALAAHTEAHFAQELAWMEQTDFPPIGCHTHEHDQVLSIMHEARNYVAEGNTRVGRVLAEELARWFEGHVQTMDGMLAQWLLRGADGAALSCGSGCEHVIESAPAQTEAATTHQPG